MAILRTEAFKYVGATTLKGNELIKTSVAGNCDLATAVTDKILGVAAHAAVTNDSLGVLMPGQVVKGIASAAISYGANVSATAAGKLVTGAAKSVTGNTTVSYYLGWALEAAAADGDIISWMFWPTEVNV